VLFVEKTTEGDGFGSKSADTPDGVVLNVRHDGASPTAAGEAEEATSATAEQRKQKFDDKQIGILLMQMLELSRSRYLPRHRAGYSDKAATRASGVAYLIGRHARCALRSVKETWYVPSCRTLRASQRLGDSLELRVLYLLTVHALYMVGESSVAYNTRDVTHVCNITS
jgi:hypothetical protein